MFATAVAMQTRRVLLGFGVLEMAMHHPVRVAVQTALLDNLSKGRLLVGIGRGSDINAFEYRGFGTTVNHGRESIDEVEDLLVKAWTATDGLEFNGRFWQVAFPAIRPRPWQKPHPPLFRACRSLESVVALAKRGRLILLSAYSAAAARDRINAYRENMLSAGFSEEMVQRNLEQIWIWRSCYVAESDDQAFDEFMPGNEKWIAQMTELKLRWDPPDQSREVDRHAAPLPRSAYGEHPDPEASELFVGSPRRVREQIEQLRDAGVSNVWLTHYGGVVPPERGMNSMRLLAEKVFPYFR